MSLPIQKLREIVFLILYAHDLSGDQKDDPTALIMQQLKISKKNTLLAFDFAAKVESYIESIDDFIEKSSKSYDIDRINRVEKNILRLALYELIYKKLDLEVVVSEAIRLGKKFSNKESSKFINAIIDFVYHEYHNIDHKNKCLT